MAAEVTGHLAIYTLNKTQSRIICEIDCTIYAHLTYEGYIILSSLKTVMLIVIVVLTRQLISITVCNSIVSTHPASIYYYTIINIIYDTGLCSYTIFNLMYSVICCNESVISGCLFLVPYRRMKQIKFRQTIASLVFLYFLHFVNCLLPISNIIIPSDTSFKSQLRQELLCIDDNIFIYIYIFIFFLFNQHFSPHR